MTNQIPFFDGHNDFLLRLMMAPDPRYETWLESAKKGHLDLDRMKQAGFNDVVALSTAPQVATHSNAYVHSASPRNLTDRQLHQIRDTGGIGGFNYATFYLHENGTAKPDMGWDAMIRHINHLIEQLGEDHVGLGSDFDGCVVPKLIGDVVGVRNILIALSKHSYDNTLLTKLARENWLSCLERSLR